MEPELNPDYRELIELLDKHGVEYLIVGGWAVIGYGYPRFTVDLDVFIRRDKENAQKLYDALKEFFSCEPPGITGPKDFLESDVVQFGTPPNRVDFISRIDGLDFDSASQGRKPFPHVPNCYFISLDGLIRNKLASGRAKDLADAEELMKIRDAMRNQAEDS